MRNEHTYPTVHICICFNNKVTEAVNKQAEGQRGSAQCTVRAGAAAQEAVTQTVHAHRGIRTSLHGFSKASLSKTAKLDQTMMSGKMCPKILTKSFKKV